MAWTDDEAEYLYGDALHQGAQVAKSLQSRTRMPDLDDYDEARSGFSRSTLARVPWWEKDWNSNFEFDW